MRKIQICGGVDKRAIVYPLLKIMLQKGKVILLTEDSNIKRLSETKDKLVFERGTLTVVMKPQITEEDIENWETKLYLDYMVIVTEEELKGVDKRIRVKGYTERLIEEEISFDLDAKEDKTKEQEEVTLIPKRVKAKKGEEKDTSIECILDRSLLEYIWHVEEKGDLLPCKHKGVQKVLVELLKEEASEIKEMLRKEGM